MTDKTTTTTIQRYAYDEDGYQIDIRPEPPRTHPTYAAAITFARRHSRKPDVESVDIRRDGHLARTYCGGRLVQALGGY